MIVWILIGIIFLMTLPALVGLDEIIQSKRLSRWYEKRDRGQQILKELKNKNIK